MVLFVYRSMRVKGILLLVFALVALRCGKEPLEVSIGQPEHGAVVSGILRIEADASSSAAGVSFFIDDSCVHFAPVSPFVHIWNTFPYADSSAHTIHAIAEDQDGNEAWSDTISVEVRNGDTLFADGFEPYTPYSYPAAGWFEIWSGAGDARVDSGTACSGHQCFRVRGLADQVRPDGVELPVEGVIHLVYEVSLLIPSTEPCGALFGFFMMLDPYIGAIYNGIWFCGDDNLIYARGIAEDSTGRVWNNDTWYTVRVDLDYLHLRMSVWLDGEQIISDLVAAPREWTDTFALATDYGSAGTVFYDDVRIFDGK